MPNCGVCLTNAATMSVVEAEEPYDKVDAMCGNCFDSINQENLYWVEVDFYIPIAIN